MPEERLEWADRLEAGWQAMKDIVGKVWPYVLLGIAVGAGIHGYVPENFMASIMGKGAWWSVPVAVLIGIPMYSNAAGIIPVVQALLGKGAALGTVLAFMMAVIGLSLPEMIILRRVLKPTPDRRVRRRRRLGHPDRRLPVQRPVLKRGGHEDRGVRPRVCAVSRDGARRAARRRAARLGADVEKVSDYQAMAEAGVVATPAVSIDGVLKVSGRIPKAEEVKGWLAVGRG